MQCSLWKRDLEDGLACRPVFKIDGTAVLMGDLLSKGKTKPNSTLFSLTDKGQKQRLPNRCGHSWSIICNADMDEIFVFLETERYRRPSTAKPCGLAGVQEQVVDGSLQLLCIDPGLQRCQTCHRDLDITGSRMRVNHSHGALNQQPYRFILGIERTTGLSKQKK